MESLGIFSVVSRRDPFERKCRKSPRVEVQIMCQSSTRTDGLAVPRPYRLRCADGRDGLQQRPGEQGHTDAPLQGRFRPGSWHLRSEEHTSELQSLAYLVCRLLLEKKKKNTI